MTTKTLLPDQFAELEHFARKWVKPSANDRYQERLDSTMEEMQAFYDATLPRGDELFAYIDQFPYDDLPEQAVNAIWLLCALSVVSSASERRAAASAQGSGSPSSALFSSATRSSALSSWSRKMMFTAPSTPITAILAVGQARFTSPRTCLELMTSYAPP